MLVINMQQHAYSSLQMVAVVSNDLVKNGIQTMVNERSLGCVSETIIVHVETSVTLSKQI